MRFELIDLNKLESDDLIHTEFLDYFKKQTDLSKYLAVGYFEPDLVALAIVFINLPLNRALLQSFKVKEGYQRKKIGTQLFLKMEEELKKLNINWLELIYDEAQIDNAAVTPFLKAQGFDDPKIVLKRYFFDLPSFHPLWYQLPLLLDDEFTLSPFNLSPDEKEEILYFVKEGAIPSETNPFHYPQALEPLNSLILRHKGKIAGWVGTHRLANDLIRYSHFFVWHQYRGSVPPIALLAHSIKLQQDAGIKYGTLELIYPPPLLHWESFVNKRLRLFAHQCQYKIYSFKKMTNN